MDNNKEICEKVERIKYANLSNIGTISLNNILNYNSNIEFSLNIDNSVQFFKRKYDIMYSLPKYFKNYYENNKDANNDSIYDRFHFGILGEYFDINNKYCPWMYISSLYNEIISLAFNGHYISKIGAERIIELPMKDLLKDGTYIRRMLRFRLIKVDSSMDYLQISLIDNLHDKKNRFNSSSSLYESHNIFAIPNIIYNNDGNSNMQFKNCMVRHETVGDNINMEYLVLDFSDTSNDFSMNKYEIIFPNGYNFDLNNIKTELNKLSFYYM